MRVRIWVQAVHFLVSKRGAQLIFLCENDLSIQGGQRVGAGVDGASIRMKSANAISGTTRDGNKWLRRTLCQVAWAHAQEARSRLPRDQ